MSGKNPLRILSLSGEVVTTFDRARDGGNVSVRDLRSKICSQDAKLGSSKVGICFIFDGTPCVCVSVSNRILNHVESDANVGSSERLIEDDVVDLDEEEAEVCH